MNRLDSLFKAFFEKFSNNVFEGPGVPVQSLLSEKYGIFRCCDWEKVAEKLNEYIQEGYVIRNDVSGGACLFCYNLTDAGRVFFGLD